MLKLSPRFTLVALAVVVALVAARSSQIQAQEGDDDGQAAMEAKLEALMDELELFYKVTTTDTGLKRFVVMFEMNGETSKIACGVAQAGTHRSMPVYSFWSWTVVADRQTAVPPAVIKLVATENDSLRLGNLSTSEDFTSVYSNCSGVLDDSTPASALFMYLAYAHVNRIDLKKQIDPILASAP